MKKVIGAVVAGTLVAGMASADIAITLNNRVRPSLYTLDQTYADGGKTSTLWDFGYSSHTDTLGIYAKGENCGADVEIALENGTSDYAQLNNRAKTRNSYKEENKDGSTQTLSMDGLYDGWMNWGAFKVSFGRFDSRFINRYNKTAVEGGLTDSDTAKYGVSNNLVYTYDIDTTTPSNSKWSTLGKRFLYDFNNATAIAGTKNPALIFDYTINADAAKILLKGGFVASRYKEETENSGKGDDVSYQGAGYVAEVDVDAEPVAVQAIFKMPTQHTLGFGLYADVKAVENLNLALGFTYGQMSEYDTYDGSTGVKTGTEYKATAYAFDLRAFYAIDSAMKVGLQGKYSSVKKDNVNNDKANTGLELIGTFQYVANDLLTAQFDAGLYMEDLDDEDKGKYAENYFKIRPAVKISASKNAAITAGFEFQTAINGGDASDAKAAIRKQKIAIPVVARVKL
jgi:hypothetical protein